MTMRITLTTRYQAWQHAVEQLGIAIAALDQANASMSDIGLSRTEGWRSLRVPDLAEQAEEILTEVIAVECDECFHKVSEHSGGCSVVPALTDTPCGCKWGLDPAVEGR
jgi:hypothetical protein